LINYLVLGGVYISITPCLGENNTILGILAIIFQKLRILPSLKRFKLNELKEMIGKQFKIVNIEKIESNQYMIVAKK